MAIDDAYSRYVMTLKPARYLRFRDVAVGHRAVRDEVPCGPNGERVSKCALYSTTTASHIKAGSLLPAFPGGTSFCFAGNQQVVLASDGDFSGDPDTTSLTSRRYGGKQSAPSQWDMTFNFWYRNPVVPSSGVNERLLCMPMAERYQYNNSGYDFLLATSFFNWNASNGSNMLVELMYKKPAQLLGTGFFANIGNSENYRNFAKLGAAIAQNVVTMGTMRFTHDSFALFRNGVVQNSFTWDHKKYALMLPAGNSYVLGSAIQNSVSTVFAGYAAHDWSTADISEFSWHDRALSDVEISELYAMGATGQFSRKIVGTVTDSVGVGLSGRLVRAHRTSGYYAGDVLGEATSAVDGTFTLYTPAGYTGSTYVLAFDDLGVAPDYNAAIQHRAVPLST